MLRKCCKYAGFRSLSICEKMCESRPETLKNQRFGGKIENVNIMCYGPIKNSLAREPVRGTLRTDDVVYIKSYDVLNQREYDDGMLFTLII